MKIIKSILTLFIFVFSIAAFSNVEMVKGYSLTEIGEHKYDASTDPDKKTEAQLMVDKLYQLGVRQINLSPRATMVDPHGTEIIPMTPTGRARSIERKGYIRLIKYIKSKGMKVGIRPIFFVVDNNGNTPYVETMPDGTQKYWWHGNIQPRDSHKWFESFRSYLDIYLAIARFGKVDEFTIGAELYSMTVGIEDQWKEHPHGFPKEWLTLLRYVKTKLSEKCRVMYDINFTDASINADGIEQYGGEFARWRYRLVDLADDNDQNWLNLSSFWREIDAIGIDMYRSLATKKQVIPNDYNDLVDLLQRTSDRYASQIDNALFEIGMATEVEKDIILKEIGFRSVEFGFINPFEYSGTGHHTLNRIHQAAAYEAIFRSFFEAGWDWFKGAVFWDASVDKNRHGPLDLGFSPIGKTETEEIIREYFIR